jgi:hypothetical protein
MKRNIKKLTVFVVIVTIAMFISAAMVSAAGKNDWKAIHGEYAATSVVTCNVYLVNGTTLIQYGTIGQLTKYTFNRDGTGTVKGKFVSVNFLPGNENLRDVSWKFTYEVADDGTITWTAVPNECKWYDAKTGDLLYTYTGGTMTDSGTFSLDKKTIVLGSVEPADTWLTLENPPGFIVRTKCNTSRVLIRVGEREDEDE